MFPNHQLSMQINDRQTAILEEAGRNRLIRLGRSNASGWMTGWMTGWLNGLVFQFSVFQRSSRVGFRKAV
jgi:hypothetical protein